MASSHLKENLECSVCLNIYTDPVTLKCGHNFCRDCIGRVLDTQGGSGGYSCPECREKFMKCPVLQKNITLCPISENLQTTQGDRDKTGISCTYCFHTPVPAVISCLHCEASLCDDHLRVHSKSPEHVLCDVTTSPENRRCSVHNKILAYYCTEDSSCICMSCRLDGEHCGHQVETLDEASEKKKKKLRNVLQRLMTEREEMEKRVQSLEEHRRKVQGKADETESASVLFRDLRRRLEDLKRRVLREISGQTEWVFLSLSDIIQDLETKKEELSRKMGDIEELCNMTDPLTVLQESDTGDLCDTEDGDDRARRDKLFHDGWDLDVAGTSHTGLSDIMSGVNVEKCPGTHICPHSTTKGKGHTNAEPSRKRPPPTPILQPSRRCPQPSPTIQLSHHQAGGPNIGGVQQTLGVLGVTDIFLDERTAGNYLHISDDGKTASWSSNRKNHPGTPKRFRCSQVISGQRFYSGRHYWEVDVGGAVYWTVGMCYPSTDRGGRQSLIGYNKKSWGLGRGWGNRYSVIHDNNEVPLTGDVPSNRVRIDLDFEAGRISFYDLCDPIRLLHTFTTTFTEPLHAAIYIGGLEGCIKICGGDQM
ncbi:E3 ubiquitin/ISG15 ligase TRIM25-like [Rana temporaria]|uniref:E3 ubiquitin/ISG15 ligase TRIM25-like n=1 Tax=Rana temporaria TaxID=8407 RepID=UPI001AADF921|nr:E3 ubiquitin/ISG15 ligase TRIM25-like [Rana temporaria]